MGAGASTEADKEGLRAVFAAYTDAVEKVATLKTQHGSSSSSSNTDNNCDVSDQAVSPAEFAAMVQEASPSLASKLKQAASPSSSGHSDSSGSTDTDGSNAANIEAFAALRGQLDNAARKMGKVGFGVQASDNELSNNCNSSGGGSFGKSAGVLYSSNNSNKKHGSPYAASMAATELKRRHPAWAGDGMEGNLQRGLIAGLLRTASLPAVRISLANGIAPPPHPRPDKDGLQEQLQKRASSNDGSADPILGPSDLQPGRRAKVTGLLAKPELNGTIVEVGTYHIDKGRYAAHGMSNGPTISPKAAPTESAARTTGTGTDTSDVSGGETTAAAVATTPISTGTETPVAAFRGLLKPDNLLPLPYDWPPEPVWALVDTGAERSALAPQEAERWGLSPLLDQSFSRSINGVGTAVGLGRVHYTQIAFPDAPNSSDVDTSSPARDKTSQSCDQPVFECGWDVFEWPSSAGNEFRAILGLDFLTKYCASMDLATSTLNLRSAPPSTTSSLSTHSNSENINANSAKSALLTLPMKSLSSR